MPVTLRRGRVTAVTERHDGIVRFEVDGRPCVAYPALTGPVALGDEVLVNQQAVELGLGSGGFDVLYANLTRGLELQGDVRAHVMKLPYTPLQHAVLHAEELWEHEPAADLAGLPVVCCSLHSQVVPACAGLGRELRIAYVQVAGGALPVPLSDTVRALREAGMVRTTISVGPCVGGEIACVSAASALAACSRLGMEAVVCAIGPGIVGTGSRYGHGALAVAEAATAASALGGIAVLAARVSAADGRERHRGLSHHTLAILELVGGAARVAWPAGLEVPEELERVEEVDASGWREACSGLPLAHMGRGPDEEPWFFAAAYAAGVLARAGTV
ncbi:MAG TPA: DUF3866 family protein [Gaiellaceae bacterium]|nr:DUF3866 family protein [Gaiellaceae bacterium]